MTKEKFKLLVWINLLILLVSALKIIFIPKISAPGDLVQIIELYEKFSNPIENYIIFLNILFLIFFFISLFLIYRFNDYGRKLYIVSSFAALCLIFSNNYAFFDLLEFILDFLNSTIFGFTIAILYFSKISKSFIYKKFI